MRDKYGVNYRPRFAIVKWTPRPAELPDESPIDPADVWQGDLLTAAKPLPQLAMPPRRVAQSELQTEF